VRATSRLVIVWTSISLVAVAVGWAALNSAIDTDSPEQVEVAALDPSVLSPTPSAGSRNALPAPATPHPSKAANRVVRAGRDTQPRKSDPSPRRTPTSRPAPAPVSPSPKQPDPHRYDEQPPPERVPPGETVREVNTQGGTAAIGYSDGGVYLVDSVPEPGYVVQGDRQAADSIVVRFLTFDHASTIYAFVDGAGVFNIKVVEEGA